MRKFVNSALIFSILVGCSVQPLNSSPTAELIPTQITIPTTIPTSVQTNPIQRIPVVLLQDGAPDDITAAMYLMLDPQVELTGIVVSNGETRPSRALAKWEDYIFTYMQRMDIQVVAGCDYSDCSSIRWLSKYLTRS